MTNISPSYMPSIHAAPETPQDKFNNQQIIEAHLPERLAAAHYEMLSPSDESNKKDAILIKKIASYLRNDKNQRRYNHDGPRQIGFIITREIMPGQQADIIHFYVEGVYALADYYYKSDGAVVSRRSHAAVRTEAG